MFPGEVWTPKTNGEGADVEVEIPTVREARCYQLYRLEGKTQPEIAELLDIKQSTVSRSVERAEEKIEALVSTGRFDREELDALLRKLTGTAPKRAA